jgi:capsular exopolysaccharide synthesis family protein
MAKIDTVLTRLKAEGTSADTTAAATDSKQTPVARTEITIYPTLPIDQSHVQDNRIVGFGGVSPNALSAYRMIRTRLLQSMRTNHWRSIAVSSAGMGEGKSLTSINLALSLSREGNQNVFLIDLDMRRPTIAKYLGVSPPRGVQDFFDGHVDAASICFRIGAPGLVVAVATESRDNSSELLSSERLPQLIDYVFTVDPKAVLLLDMPPLLVADDALAVAPRVDAILLVATEGKTKRTDLAGAIELVQQFGLAGVILNRSGESVTRYY